MDFLFSAAFFANYIHVRIPKTECKISKLTGHELFFIGGNRVLPSDKRSRRLQYGKSIHGFRHPSNRTVQRRHGHEPYRHRACLHRNRVAAPSRAQPVRRKERDCRLCQQGPVFREEDAEIPCHAPSAATDIRQQHNRNRHQPPAMDGQCHRPRGTYLRHRRDGLHQQRQHAAQTACPAPLQDIRG